MDKKPQLAFIPLFIAAAAACGLLTVCFAEKWVAHVLLAVCVVSFSIGLIAMAACLSVYLASCKTKVGSLYSY